MREIDNNPKARAGWYAYISSLRDEVSSKVFYRNFRSKFSNSDISSLHVTPDWDHPDSKAAPTDDSDTILSELAKYYAYLFAPKQSTLTQSRCWRSYESDRYRSARCRR